MSRFKRFANSLVSGYVLLAANILYTLASVPLALHYLSKEEFGLWVLVTQVCNFNQIVIDLGMSGAIARILIDHKDDCESTAYGTVIQTGFLVLVVQGGLIAVIGGLLSYWLPQWMEVPMVHWHLFRLLVIGQCVLLAVSFALRIFTFILQAHQRYDIGNYAQLACFALAFVAQWVSFEAGLGLYSLLVAGAVSVLALGVSCGWATQRLQLFPAPGRWGKPSWKAFKELLAYGTDVFLATIGLQLITASQSPIIARTLGLEAVAVWGVATKLFMLSQQLVFRLLDFSTAAFSEMMVRGEHVQLQKRFHELVVLSASASAALGFTMALCNQAFLSVWTHARISWAVENDVLMAFSLVIYSSTRCHVGLAYMTKQIRAMKYIYLMEGVAFVALGLFLAPRLGLGGVILSGILTNLIFTGSYGLHRSRVYFGIRVKELLFDWWKRPAYVLCITLTVGCLHWLAIHSLPPLPQLCVGGSLMGMAAGFTLWKFGLPETLRQESWERCLRLRTKLWARK